MKEEAHVQGLGSIIERAAPTSPRLKFETISLLGGGQAKGWEIGNWINFLAPRASTRVFSAHTHQAFSGSAKSLHLPLPLLRTHSLDLSHPLLASRLDYSTWKALPP
jgi:hypothetical protein